MFFVAILLLFVCIIVIVIVVPKMSIAPTPQDGEKEGFVGALNTSTQRELQPRVASLVQACELLSRKNEHTGWFTYNLPRSLRVGELVLDHLDIVRKKGNVHVTTSNYNEIDWFSDRVDAPAWVIVDGNMRIDTNVTLKPDKRKMFTLLYVNGDLRLDGEVSMSGKGGYLGMRIAHPTEGTTWKVSPADDNKLHLESGDDVDIVPVMSTVSPDGQVSYVLSFDHDGESFIISVDAARRVRFRNKSDLSNFGSGENFEWKLDPGSTNTSPTGAFYVSSRVPGGGGGDSYLGYDTARDELKCYDINSGDPSSDVNAIPWKRVGGCPPVKDIKISTKSYGSSNPPVIPAKSNISSRPDAPGAVGYHGASMATGSGGFGNAKFSADPDFVMSRGMLQRGSAFGGGVGGHAVKRNSDGKTVKTGNVGDHENGGTGGTLIIVCTGRLTGGGRLTSRGTGKNDGVSYSGGKSGGGSITILCRDIAAVPYIDVSGGKSYSDQKTGNDKPGGKGGDGTYTVVKGYGPLSFNPDVGALDGIGLTKKPVAAYALRRLFGSYAGPQVRVRRGSDNLEADVYFDRHGKLTLIKDTNGWTGRTLSDWYSNGTPQVLEWFDQSRSSSGSVSATMYNFPMLGKDGIVFNGTNQYGLIPSIDGTTNFTQDDNYSIFGKINLSSTQNDRGNGDNDIIEKWKGGTSYPYVLRYDRPRNSCISAAYDSSTSSSLRTDTGSMPSGKFLTFGGVFDWANSKQVAFSNGSIKRQSTANLSTISNDTPVNLMRRGNSINYVTGTLSSVLIFDVALGDDSIQKINSMAI